MRAAELSLRVSLRKQPCVLDPTLLLAYPHGPELAIRLAQVLEPWLTRSFWQIIDCSELLALQEHASAGPACAAPLLHADSMALTSWIALRDRTDAGSWPLRWVGDNLPESQLGEAGSVEIIERYEHLAAALAERTESGIHRSHSWGDTINPLLATLDAVALSATLGGAVILSALTPAGLPWPVQVMMVAGVSPVQFDGAPTQSLFHTERAWLRDLLVAAGLAVVAQRLPSLAVVHVQVDSMDAALVALQSGDAAPDPWSGANAWWYLL